jgi:lambda family phage minor tail protein L
VAGVKLPRRQFIQNACTWLYRGADCGYTGDPVANEFGLPTTILANDACGKRLTDCQARFGAQAILPYGGFPACGLIHQ